MRILFDKNVPVGVRGFLRKHEVRIVVEMQWPAQLDNGELLRMAEEAGFDVIITSDQNIRYQQSLTGRKLRFGCPRIQHLAGRTAARRGNKGPSRWSKTGRALLHRNDARGETAKA